MPRPALVPVPAQAEPQLDRAPPAARPHSRVLMPGAPPPERLSDQPPPEPWKAPPTAPDDRHAPLPPIPDVAPAEVPQPFAPAVAAPEAESPRYAPLTPDSSPAENEAATPTDQTSRRFSIVGVAGEWAIAGADGSGLHWSPAFGLQAGFAPLEWIETELLVLRTQASAGNGFANASAAHTLFLGRALFVLPVGPFAALLGIGGGVALSQTHYVLQDVGASAQTLDSSGVKPVVAPVFAVRLRPWRGLELRAEVSTLLRDGRIEPAPTGSLGYAF